MDLSHQRVEQYQVTPPDDDSIHGDFDNDIRGWRFESYFGVIEGIDRDMVIELGLESGGSGVVGSGIDVSNNGFDEPDDDDFFVERRDFGPEFHDIASMGSNIRLITVESDSESSGGDDLENERDIWRGYLNELDVYVNDDDDDDDDDDGEYDDDDVSVTIPLCWDSLQLEDRGVTADEFDWEEVDDGGAVGDEIEMRTGFAQVDFNDEISVSAPVSPINSLEDLQRERAEGNRGWEVLLNHNLDINFDVENRELYIVGDHDDYFQTTENELLFEQFSDAEISVLGLPPTSKFYLENLLLIVRLDGDNIDDGVVCAVCKDEMIIGNEAVQLPCNHKYHRECIVPWLKVRNTCPVCRHELPTDDAEYEQRKIQRTRSTFDLAL